MAKILEAGRNCWRITRADRAALLIDGAAYFSAVRAAARTARRSIFAIGWDFDSRVPVPPDGDDDGLPRELGPFLNALAKRNESLHVHLLEWDFVLLYALDREFLPIYNLGWRTHDRVHFQLDDRHPPGGSHHQKIVVIDDELAFVGGFDLTKSRWDRPEHAADEPLRKTPEGEPYAPFHDVQLMVDGETAAALGELARERWRRATGEEPESSPRPDRGGRERSGERDRTHGGHGEADRDDARTERERGGGAHWPEHVGGDFVDAEVGIARTEPFHDGLPEVREVRQLYIDSIAAAKHSIYVENQYFTSADIAEALATRLREADGPEVVIVTRRTGGGWLEQNTMEVLRARLLNKLFPRDVYGRLRVYCPEHGALGGDCINVHSKLMIVDDRLLRVGSSNLNNRSMGFDTECDLAVEARDKAQSKAILAIRDRLLGEHLGVEPRRVAQAIASEGSMIAAIESLEGNERRLDRFAPDLDPEVDRLVPDQRAIDPERPIDPERLVDEMVPDDDKPATRKRVIAAVAMLALVVLLAVGWRWGPLSDWLDRETLKNAAAAAEASTFTPLWVLLAYLAASATAFPITLLIVATAFAFGPWTAFGYALAGSLIGAGLTFAVGHHIGRGTVRELAGSRLNSLSRKLADGGVFTVVALRMLPVAPFTIVNLVAGASHLRVRDFLIGTVLGMSPGILAISVFSDRLAAAISDPSPTSIAVLALVVLAVGAVALTLRTWLRGRARKRQREGEGASG